MEKVQEILFNGRINEEPLSFYEVKILLSRRKINFYSRLEGDTIVLSDLVGNSAKIELFTGRVRGSRKLLNFDMSEDWSGEEYRYEKQIEEAMNKILFHMWKNGLNAVFKLVGELAGREVFVSPDSDYAVLIDENGLPNMLWLGKEISMSKIGLDNKSNSYHAEISMFNCCQQDITFEVCDGKIIVNLNKAA